MNPRSEPLTERSRQKADRRVRLLQIAARLFAERGFGAVSIEDLGSAAGVTGPALYRHFTNKQNLLAELLVGTSYRLLHGGRHVVAKAQSNQDALKQLVTFHTNFAITEPDLIRIQERDLAHLPPLQARSVRQLQRGYVEIWVSVLTDLYPDMPFPEARTRAHATFGLLNSTPYSATSDINTTTRILQEMASAALAAGRSPKKV